MNVADEYGFPNNIITNWNGLSYSDVGPSDTSWNANEGMGRVYSCSNCTGSGATSSIYSFTRGGSWADGDSGGIYSLAFLMGPADTTAYSDVGFRCAK
jgi:formylglycine-generating enzyme required for sulfatase activity